MAMSLARRHPIAAIVVWLLLTFLVLFPKGGIEAFAGPLTWGYILLMGTAPVLTVVRFLRFPLLFQPRLVVAVGLLIPFQVIFIYTWLANGTYGFALSLITLFNLFVLPFLFLLVYPSFLKYIDGIKFRRHFCNCVLLAALWGIFLFFWHPFTGHYIEIPYLTVNAGDYGQLEATKHINRGYFYKLISTYNNGNLYGVATLILLPLYNLMEKRFWKRTIVKVALLLTLSRSVWAGVVVEQAYSLLPLMWEQVKTFPRVYLRTAKKRFVAVAMTLLLVFVTMVFNSRTLSFLFDSTLGGRSGEVTGVGITLLPAAAVTGFNEIVYVSALNIYGVFGLLAFLMIFLGPIIVLMMDDSAWDDPARRAAFKGLMVYVFMMGLDGGINYPPTMTFYWFAYMTFLFGLPRGATKRGQRQAVPVRPEFRDDERPFAVAGA